MKNKRNIIFMWVLAVLPALILLSVYGRLPDIVPTNFGFDGRINAYGPKATLWIFVGINLLMALLFQFMPSIDPKKRNYAKFQKHYDIFAIFMELFMLAVLCLVLSEILRPGTVSIGRCITALLSILFIVIGNMMGKIKHNYFFGVKTPWTLADPDIWARTHRLCGRVWFLLGVLLLPCCLLLPETVFFVILMVGILGSTLLLYVLSYVWFKQKNPA